MSPQIIKASNGEELVVLTRAEYDALVAAAEPYDEDADAVAIFDARMAELAAGGDARLPPQVTSAMLRGHSLLKAIRNWKDITQTDLSFRTNLSQNYISELESGRRKGTKETLALIAEKMGVDKSWLVG